MTAVTRPCLNRGPRCRDLPGYCFAGPDAATSDRLYHAHCGMQPDECRMCGQQHDGDRFNLCAHCEAQVDARCRSSRTARSQTAALSNPHLDFTKLTDGERFRLEYEEIA